MAQAKAPQRALTSIDVSDPKLYQEDSWRPLFAKLRRDDPVHYCETSRFGPYWSITRYDDIFAVELDHENYSSSSELGGIQIAEQPKGHETASFIRMDPPGHTPRSGALWRRSWPRVTSRISSR
jgi:cytochrome P450